MTCSRSLTSFWPKKFIERVVMNRFLRGLPAEHKNIKLWASKEHLHPKSSLKPLSMLWPHWRLATKHRKLSALLHSAPSPNANTRSSCMGSRGIWRATLPGDLWMSRCWCLGSQTAMGATTRTRPLRRLKAQVRPLAQKNQKIEPFSPGESRTNTNPLLCVSTGRPGSALQQGTESKKHRSGWSTGKDRCCKWRG